MSNIIITSRLSHIQPKSHHQYRFLSFRNLSKKELSFARGKGFHRFYLPSLSQEDSKEFFSEFDRFWDELISPFTSHHPFWRTCISSKMQEWHFSLGYFLLVLFSLKFLSLDEKSPLIVVCSCIEEEQVFVAFCQKNQIDYIYCSRSILLRKFHQSLNNWFHFIKKSYLCLRAKSYSGKKRVPLVRKDENSPLFLIASQFYARSIRGGAYSDPFFGVLHKSLKEKGISSVYLSDPLYRPDKRLNSEIRNLDVDLFLPFSLIGVAEIIVLLWDIAFRRISFGSHKFLGCEMSFLAKWYARRFCDYRTFLSEVFYLATRNLCQKNDFTQLINLYEGNVYERACNQAFREFAKGGCVGYGQGVVYPLNLKLHLTKQDNAVQPLSDKIACTGKQTLELLLDRGNQDKHRLMEGCSLRYIPSVGNSKEKNRNLATILIALDGVPSTVNLLDWVCEHADVFKGYEVIIRTHPNVPYQEVSHQMVERLPDAFSISTASLEEDIRSSFCVFYRHTSVGMQAILSGVCAVHLGIDSPLPGDPIENLQEGKWSVYDAAELTTVLREIKSLGHKEKENLFAVSQKSICEYFSPPSKERINHFIL